MLSLRRMLAEWCLLGPVSFIRLAANCSPEISRNLTFFSYSNSSVFRLDIIITFTRIHCFIVFFLLFSRKVLSKLSLELSGEVIRALTQCRQWAIESFLTVLRDKIDFYLASKKGQERRYNGGLGGGLGGNFLSEPDVHQFSSRSTAAFSDKTEVDQHHSHRSSGEGGRE